MPLVSARTVTAANQWTTPIFVAGSFTVTIRRAGLNAGTVGLLGGTTVTVQRSTDGGVTYQDVDRWKRTSEDLGFEGDVALYTIGVKSGEFGTGGEGDVFVGIAYVGAPKS
ncbi:hypothetical protein UFOVP824_17 [uncultured Caudovirales phage]|uniref:Uncharacterized protein n=1 Tax=uncultured Caudovirales phage TaxID=2100421 RepID=A0A6J5P0Z4_9CAUD|nr:hypothetical protein UFOVP824_17 [uncultured Caudovirales phage]